MLLARLHRPQSLSQACATATQLRRISNDQQEPVLFRNLRFVKTKSAADLKPRQSITVAAAANDWKWLRIKLEKDQNESALGAERRSNSSTSIRQPTLFEELFPEEAAKDQQQGEPKTNSRQAYLPREFEWAKSWPDGPSTAPFTISPKISIPLKDPKSKSQTPQVALEADLHTLKQRRDASVLILSNASKSLSASDFMRLSPKGLHIEGWLSGILKVIPGRDTQTLEPLGHYFILFSTPAAANAYADNVHRLHYLSRTYTPTGVESAMPPPPGYIRDGEDIHRLMAEFTLVPASMPTVNLRKLKRPFSPSVQKLIEDGGVPALVRRQEKCANLVLVSFSNGSDYGFVSEFEVRRWLSLDGRKRGLGWGLIGGEDDIVRLDGRSEEDAEESVGWRERERRAKIGKKRLPSRFVLSFKEDVEARRFVRDWHKREFVVDGRLSDNGEAPTIIDAQHLW